MRDSKRISVHGGGRGHIGGEPSASTGDEGDLRGCVGFGVGRVLDRTARCVASEVHFRRETRRTPETQSRP
jgi:hypothetical protein